MNSTAGFYSEVAPVLSFPTALGGEIYMSISLEPANSGSIWKPTSSGQEQINSEGRFMKMKLLVLIGFLAAAGCSVPALAQVGSALQHEPSSSLKAANPQMRRLAALLAGDWDSVEKMERSSFFPQGGSRRGKVHVRLASGGYTLVYEVHSNGTAGELDGFHVIWWDPKAKAYRFFACFNDAKEPCIELPSGKAKHS
jgi:hypothetical protein